MGFFVPIAMMAVGAAMSAAQASHQNSIAKQGMNSALSANKYNKKNLELQGIDQKDKVARNLARYNGAVTASTADRGIGFDSGTFLALLNSSSASARQDMFNINTNTKSAQWADDNQTTNRINQLRGGMRNPGFAGIMGGMQGLQMGMSIQSGFSQMNQGDPGLTNQGFVDPRQYTTDSVGFG